MEFTETVVEEEISLPPFTQAVTAYLSECFALLEAGDEDRIMADPFYESHLTDEQIDTAIEALDAEYDREWGGFPDYHRNRQGCDGPTAFYRLSQRARRAMVEGLQQIVAQYHPAGRDEATIPTTAEPSDEPIAYG